jgi:hypothetical protein
MHTPVPRCGSQELRLHPGRHTLLGTKLCVGLSDGCQITRFIHQVGGPKRRSSVYIIDGECCKALIRLRKPAPPTYVRALLEVPHRVRHEAPSGSIRIRRVCRACDEGRGWLGQRVVGEACVGEFCDAQSLLGAAVRPVEVISPDLLPEFHLGDELLKVRGGRGRGSEGWIRVWG